MHSNEQCCLIVLKSNRSRITHILKLKYVDFKIHKSEQIEQLQTDRQMDKFLVTQCHKFDSCVKIHCYNKLCYEVWVKGNVFTLVCHSVHGGGGLPTRGLHPGGVCLQEGRVFAYRGSASGGSAYRGICLQWVCLQGWSAHPPIPELEKRAVCILLECFLVLFLFFTD